VGFAQFAAPIPKSLKVVQAFVFGVVLKDEKIAMLVIESVAVDMMNYCTFGQRLAQNFLHDQPM
jgi:hypothetical protein